MRYRFYPTDNKVICVSSYAGRAVRGIAKCDPKDTFNLDDGKKLAQARCDVKIAQKRVVRAAQRREEALKAYNASKEYLAKMDSYVDESNEDLAKCVSELEAIEKSL